MQVYVVEWGMYSNREVIGVFSTAELAERAAQLRGNSGF